MIPPSSSSPHGRRLGTGFGAVLALWLVAAPLSGVAHAAATVVPLRTAADFSVLAGSAVTNTGPSTIGADLGVSPGTSLPAAGLTVGGSTHSNDAVAQQAQLDLTAAYNNAAGQTPPTVVPSELGGTTLVGGVYNLTSDAQVTGPLTLNGQNDPDAVWVFQVGSALTTASSSSVLLINGANPCNVFWQIGSSATFGADTRFVGTVMADQSITMTTRAQLIGRALARNGAVTLDTNVISVPQCAAAPPDPITPDPITPDPITPDPITPDPTTPDPTTPTVPVDVPGAPGNPDNPNSPDGSGSNPDNPGAPATPSAPGAPTTPGTSTPPQVPRPPGGSVDAGSVAAPQRDLGLLAVGLSLVGLLGMVDARTRSPHGRHRR